MTILTKSHITIRLVIRFNVSFPSQISVASGYGALSTNNPFVRNRDDAVYMQDSLLQVNNFIVYPYHMVLG